MKLKNWLGRLFSGNKGESVGTFLAVAIALDRATAVTWRVAGETVDIFGQGAAVFSEEAGIPEAVEAAADLALDGEEPTKFFLGVPPEWIDGGKLVEDKKGLVDKIGQRLQLPAGGRVPVLEALLAYLKNLKKQTTAILVESSRNRLRISVVRAGQLLDQRLVSRRESEVETIEAALRESRVEPPFPSRIVVIGESDDESRLRAISRHDWPDKFFSHLPVVSSLEDGFLAEAVAFVSAINLQRSPKTPPAPSEEREGLQAAASAGSWARRPEIERTGFELGGDVSLRTVEPPPPPPPRPPAPPSRWLEGLGRLPSQIVSLIPAPPRPRRRPRGNWLVLFAAAAVTLAAPVLVYLKILRAEVTLIVDPQTFSGSLPLFIGETPSAQSGEKVIAAVKDVVEVEGEKEVPTTGTKLVGDPAKGEVAVYNRTLSAKTFAAGSVLVGPNGLKFSLTSPVTVEAATVATSSGSETKTYGKASVGVTAQDIGEAGNLPAKTKFTFADYSAAQYLVESKSAFSGGSSREVRVVSKQDRDSLAEKLEAELKDKAKEASLEKVEPGREVIPEGIELKISEENFSADVGEETDKLSLSAKAKATAYLYRQDDVKALVTSMIGDQAPEGYQIVEDQIKVEVKYEKSREGGILTNVNFTATLLPELDLERAKRAILGKSPGEAKAGLRQAPHVRDVKVKIWPGWLPEKLSRIPRFPDRVEMRLAGA
jgi:hypothetical protein